MNKLKYLLTDEDISEDVVAHKLGVKTSDVADYVQSFGIRQCDTCKKRYFEPDHIRDLTCLRCFNLALADFNLEFMTEIGAINEQEAIKIRDKIKNITSD